MGNAILAGKWEPGSPRHRTMFTNRIRSGFWSLPSFGENRGTSDCADPSADFISHKPAALRHPPHLWSPRIAYSSYSPRQTGVWSSRVFLIVASPPRSSFKVSTIASCRSTSFLLVQFALSDHCHPPPASGFSSGYRSYRRSFPKPRTGRASSILAGLRQAYLPIDSPGMR